MTKFRIVLHVRFHLLVHDLFLLENFSSERFLLTLFSEYPLFLWRISKSRGFLLGCQYGNPSRKMCNISPVFTRGYIHEFWWGSLCKFVTSA